MLIYITAYLLITAFAFISPKQKKYSLITIIILCIIVFFRDTTVGTDVMNYSVNFRKINWHESSWNYYIPFEPGFNYFILFFKNYILNDHMICWGTIGIIYVLCFYKFAKKYTSNINVALFCFYALGTYFLVFNIMRQSFACAILLLLFSYINLNNPSKKDIIISIIGIFLIGLLFHPTIYIFYVFLLFYTKQIQNMISKKLMVFLLIISFVIFYTQAIIPLISSFIDTTSAEGKLINYATKNIQNDENSGFSMLKIILITVFQTYLIISSYNPKNIFLFMGTCGVIFLNCFGILVLEFVRVYELFIVLQIIYLSEMWNVKKHNMLAKLYKPILLLYTILIFFNIIIKNYGEIVPYNFRTLF